MPGPFDFKGQKIQDTYGRVVQIATGSLYDGKGTLINANIQAIADASNQRQSESIELSAISSSVVELQHFSSSLDADFATDAELSALSSSILVTTNNLADGINENEEELNSQGARIATLTASTSSYVTFPYTGSAIITGSLEVTGTLSLNDGNNNTVIGDTNPSLSNIATRNTLIGYKAGHYLESGSDNVFIGYEAGVSESIAGSFNSRGNVAIGPYALSNNAYGTSHIAIGKNALKNVTRNSVNIAIGNGAGQNLSGNVGSNIFIGSVGPSGGSQTIAIGQDAVAGNSSGQNIGIGLNAARFSGGVHNLVVGYAAGYNGLGGYTTVLGNFAAYLYQGNSIVALGYKAGNSGVGNNSIIIGKEAGYYASGSDNVIIGHQAGYNLTGSNQLIIANNSASALITGDFAEETLHISGTILATTGSFSHLKGNSPITVQDPVIFQHDQGLDVLGNATIHSINEVELQTISKDFNYTSSLNVTEITSSVEGAIIDYRLTRLDSGSRVGTFMYAHDGTTLSYNDTTIPGAGLGDEPTLSATLNTGSSIVSIDIENAAGFNFTGYAKKFNKLANAIPVADPNVTYLLNQYPSENIVGAYSIRQLDQFYTGSAMRVREAGSNNEIDIEFDVNGYLDTLAITAHCGSNIGYVTIWYDQSGNNNHLTQSVAGNQPKIYDGSSIYEINGQPCLRTRDGASPPALVGPTGIDYTGGLSMYQVLSNAGYGARTPVVGSAYNDYGSGGWRFQHSTYLGFLQVGSNSTSFQNPRNDDSQVVEAGFYDSITNNISAFVKQQYAGNFTPLQTGSGTSIMPSTTEDTLFVNPRGNYQELIIMNDYEISNREGIFTNINDYYNIYETGLLAEYGGAAAAYSVRQLTTAYTGSAFLIREDGTNTETDIGFDSNGDLDTASIASHCGANNGLVVTWYDQSGNGNDATQSTVGDQPLIYSASAVITENGKPALSKGVKLSSTFSNSISQPVSIYTVHTDLNTNYYHNGITNNLQLRGFGGVYQIFGDNATQLYMNSPTRAQLLNQQILLYNLYNGANSEIALNSNTPYTGSIDTNGTAGFAIQTINLKRQEFIVFEADNTNRNGIVANINSYFNIYS